MDADVFYMCKQRFIYTTPVPTYSSVSEKRNEAHFTACLPSPTINKDQIKMYQEELKTVRSAPETHSALHHPYELQVTINMYTRLLHYSSSATTRCLHALTASTGMRGVSVFVPDLSSCELSQSWSEALEMDRLIRQFNVSPQHS